MRFTSVTITISQNSYGRGMNMQQTAADYFNNFDIQQIYMTDLSLF